MEKYVCLMCNFFVKEKFFNNVFHKFSASLAVIIEQFQIVYWENEKECEILVEGIRNCGKGDRVQK